MDPLPLNGECCFHKSCCGQVLCITCHEGIVASGHTNCSFRRAPDPVTTQDAQQLLFDRVVAGDLAAITQLGQHYLHGMWAGLPGSDVAGEDRVGFPHDISRAFDLTKCAAEQGCVDAMYNLAQSYVQGMPKYKCAKLSNQAFYWFHKAAEHGEMSAVHNLACCYGNGLGTEKSWPIAKTWFLKGSLLGDPASVEHLEWMLDRGHGGVTKEDLARARAGYNEVMRSIDEASQKARLRMSNPAGHRLGYNPLPRK